MKVYLQDSITVDNFPTLHLFITKLGWEMPYIGLHDILGSKVTYVSRVKCEGLPARLYNG